MKKLTATVIIPTFNGLPLLKKHLDQIIKLSPKGTDVIVVDDASIDGTVEWLKKEYPAVTCLQNHKNLGFTKSVNLGVDQVTSDLIVLLNNDVAVTKDYLESALTKFDDKSVFAVTFNEIHSSWPEVSFQGKLNYIRAEDKIKPHYSCWASGGSAVFRKQYWTELGGFDEVYSPGYWEDIDLGYRAWKAGYTIIWDPDSKVVHEHESSFNKFDKNYLNLIKQRNELIFNWKNITNMKLRLEHLGFLLGYTITHPGYLKVILSALSNYAKIKPVNKKVRSDMEILSLVNQVVQ